MKIKKIHIISFGGLKNFTLDFADGFNCIYGENEKGKTTVMSFIKMMFYGNERSSSQLSKNIRKKYTPWDSSPMAGSIEFEIDGRNFKLEREFRSSNSTDKVSLTDLNLGEKQAVEGDIGVRLFAISAAAFERSIFIGQLGFPDSDQSAESELNARLSNIVTTGDEKVSLEQVISRLEKARFSIISKSGKAGEYYKNTLLKNELSDKLETAVKAEKQYIEGKEKLIAFENETELLTKKAEHLRRELSKERDIKNAQKLKELLETKEALEKLKSEICLNDGSPADESFLRNLKFSVAKYENAKQKTVSKEKETKIVKKQLDTLLNGPKLQTDETPEKLNSDMQMLNKNADDLQSKISETKKRIEELTDKEQNNKSSTNPTLLILGICLLIVSGIMYFAVGPASLTFTAVSIIFIALSFVLKSDKNSAALKEQILSLENILNSQSSHLDNLKAQIADKKAKTEAIKLVSSSNAQVIEAQRSQLLVFEGELLILKNEEQLLLSEVNKLLSNLNQNYTNIDIVFNILENSAEKQKELKQQINFLLKDLNNISYEEAALKLREIENSGPSLEVDFEAVKTQYEQQLQEINRRNTTQTAVKTELKAIMNGVESPDVLRLKLKEVTELLASQKAFCDSADIALEVLKESFAELRAGYGSELEKASAEIFSLLTKGKYNNMTISKSFGLNVEERDNPISREAEYLSSGTYDQAYLSVRLAVAKLLDNDLPIFLDDTLTQYDDIRANATLKFLNEYSKSCQAIMFTCHKTIYDFAEKLDCNVTKL